MKHLYKFHWDCGRSGELDGLFVATEREVEEIIGEEVYFGEVLGKHSEVYGTIEEGEIQKLDISPKSVAEVSKYLGETWSGFNPLEYIMQTCDECEEERRADEWICEYREEFGRTLCDECVEELNKKLEVLERAIDEASKIFGVDPAYFGKEGEEEVDRQLRNLGYNPEDFRKD